MYPGAIVGLPMQPRHCPRRRGHYDAYPIVHACPALLRHPPLTSPSDASPHPPPIEYCGGERISLRHSSIPLKSCPVITARPCHHCQQPPINPEDPTSLGTHAVALQDIKAPGPVQGVIRLVQVQEDHVQDIIPQGR